MKPARVIYMSWTRCAQELDDEFNEWYNEEHVPMATAGGQVSVVTRYRLSGEVDSDLSPYLTILEFEDDEKFKAWLASDALAAAREDTRTKWQGRDMQTTSRAFYVPIWQWTHSLSGT